MKVKALVDLEYRDFLTWKQFRHKVGEEFFTSSENAYELIKEKKAEKVIL